MRVEIVTSLSRSLCHITCVYRKVKHFSACTLLVPTAGSAGTDMALRMSMWFPRRCLRKSKSFSMFAFYSNRFAEEDPHSRPPPSHGPHRSSPNSLTALWNALRLKRANTRHENDAAAAAASSTAASGLGLSGSTLKPDGATSDVSRKSSFR